MRQSKHRSRGEERVFRLTEKAGGLKYFRACCAKCGIQTYWKPRQFLEKPFICKHCADKVTEEEVRAAEESRLRKFPDYKRFKAELEKLAETQPASARKGGKNKTRNWMGVWPIARPCKEGGWTTTAIHANCHSCGKQYSSGVPHFIKSPYICKTCSKKYTAEELEVRRRAVKAKVSDYERKVQEGIREAGRYAAASGEDLMASKKMRAAINLQHLLPQQKVKCINCGEVRPCQDDWKETSLVLCPTCYAEMGRGEASRLHEECRRRGISAVHLDGYDRIKDPMAVAEILEDVHRWIVKCTAISINDAVDVNAGMGDSDDMEGDNLQATLENASIDELKQLVKIGKVSKARARIELRRRANPRYYGSLPDVEEVPIFLR